MSTPESQIRLRLFCAVELPADVRARAAEHLTHLRASASDVKATWERAEKLHITIKFFGEVEVARVPALTEAVARAASAVPAFEMSLAGAGVFPTGGNPRVLWLGVQDTTGQLSRLQQRLEDECATIGFAHEPRPFHAHVTLARIRAANAAARHLARHHVKLGFAPAAFPVTELILMRSDLAPGGSHYTPRARHKLSGGGQ
jgi:RNA 2',3'-cyclic 3'-phosphodiesterase